MLNQAKHQHHQKQRQTGCAGITDLELLECQVVNVIDNGAGGVRWSPLGHQKHLFKHLGGRDGRNHGNQRHIGAQQRQGDVEVLPPANAAIELSGFIEVFGNALQPGQKDDHVVAEAFPKGHQHHRGQGEQRIGEETDRREGITKQRLAPAIDQAVFGIEPAEGNGGHHDRNQHRGVEGAAEPIHPRQGAVHQHRQG